MDITVRPLEERDLPEADRIFRLAFGTFLGLPDPLAFLGDVDLVYSRWRAAPADAIAADVDGQLAGSMFVANWGSVGFFGPLTVLPEHWDKGVGRRLLDATMEKFEAWGTRYSGLFTFAHSPKHLFLYQKYGFHPRFLTPIMSKPATDQGDAVQWSRYSELSESEQKSCLDACRELTGAILEGLDVEREIVAVQAQKLGDTVLVWEGPTLAGFAVCHCGPGSEGGSDVCYVKFGAARPGSGAGQSESFERLLEACEAFAARQGLSRLVAGANAGRPEAYGQMIARGFRANLVGVAMHRDNHPGYNRPEAYIIDDWR
jgi:GNAT superfamily N-acetyltransferase